MRDFVGKTSPDQNRRHGIRHTADSGLPADLLFVVSRWQGLPVGIRSAIAAIVQAQVGAHGR